MKEGEEEGKAKLASTPGEKESIAGCACWPGKAVKP